MKKATILIMILFSINLSANTTTPERDPALNLKILKEMAIDDTNLNIKKLAGMTIEVYELSQSKSLFEELAQDNDPTLSSEEASNQLLICSRGPTRIYFIYYPKIKMFTFKNPNSDNMITTPYAVEESIAVGRFLGTTGKNIYLLFNPDVFLERAVKILTTFKKSPAESLKRLERYAEYPQILFQSSSHFMIYPYNNPPHGNVLPGEAVVRSGPASEFALNLDGTRCFTQYDEVYKIK